MWHGGFATVHRAGYGALLAQCMVEELDALHSSSSAPPLIVLTALLQVCDVHRRLQDMSLEVGPASAYYVCSL